MATTTARKTTARKTTPAKTAAAKPTPNPVKPTVQVIGTQLHYITVDQVEVTVSLNIRLAALMDAVAPLVPAIIVLNSDTDADATVLLEYLPELGNFVRAIVGDETWPEVGLLDVEPLGRALIHAIGTTLGAAMGELLRS